MTVRHMLQRWLFGSEHDRSVTGVTRRTGIAKVLAAVMILMLLPGCYYALAQRSYAGTISPFDEQTHIAYAWSVSHGHLPANGDRVPEEVLKEWSCSGWRSVADNATNPQHLPPCGTTDPLQYPAGGEQYNAFHPPLYYLITGLTARVAAKVIPSVSFTQAARAMSVAWMVAGLMMLFVALRRWKISVSASLAVCALVPYIPVFLNTGTAVTNDAPALLCGAAFLWMTADWFERQRYHLLVPCVITILACMVKGTFAFPLLAVLFVMAVHAVLRLIRRNDPATAKRELAVSVITGMLALIVVFGWSSLQSHRGVPGYVAAISGVNTTPVHGLPVGEFLNTLMQGFELGGIPQDLRGTDSSAGYAAWLAIIQIVIGGSAFFLYFQRDKVESHTLLLCGTVFGMLLIPSMVQIREYLNSGSMFGSVTTRYGLPLLPYILCCWALAVQNRKARALSWGVATIGAIICWVAVLGMAPYSAA
ncbi:glycosyltransferase family 39 protein [Bifidobacterium sp. 82T10]|uniref:Glycosyltransferase family 39 protein n=1 Tax=Bifidobacterium miconis TaxID=2834435 RepID=A0ABS6WGW3_9BIFI|nr:glycosyltransferase family 39 protein [Bifidobacterium miconis]MBW3093273.1 glycosyltransferase family 39 protein [Bifidobacterium miconis]